MTKIIAHRGASGEAPENTMAAFRRALEVGADGIELDVHLSKNGIPVVIHDFDLDRTTDGMGLVRGYDDDELTVLDAGSWKHPDFAAERIPLLSEVLELCQNTKEGFVLNIELKAGSSIYPDIEEKVLELVKQYKMKEKVIISSYDHFALQKMRELDADIALGALFSAGVIDPWLYHKKHKFNAYHAFFIRLNQEIVESCQKNGIAINTYTINDPNYAGIMLELGVDSIITDLPDTMLKLRSQFEVEI